MSGLEGFKTDLDLENGNEPLLDGEFSEDGNEDFKEFTNDFSIDEPEEENEEEEEDPGADPVDVNFEEEEQEEEENEDDVDLKALNEKLGTDFTDLTDLKKALKKEDAEESIETEKTEYRKHTEFAERLNNWIASKDEDLVRAQYTAEYANKQKNTSDPDIIAEIEDKIEGLIALGELESKANAIRTNLTSSLNKANADAAAIKNKWEQNDANIAKSNREALQNSLAEIVKSKNFYGVVVPQSVAVEVYKKVKSGDFAKEINSSQKDIAEFALFKHYRDQIIKNASGPTHSDGVKRVIDEISGNKERKLSQAQGGTSNSGGADLISAFTK